MLKKIRFLLCAALLVEVLARFQARIIHARSYGSMASDLRPPLQGYKIYLNPKTLGVAPCGRCAQG
jgi:hypothetical protein